MHMERKVPTEEKSKKPPHGILPAQLLVYAKTMASFPEKIQSCCPLQRKVPTTPRASTYKMFKRNQMRSR